MTRVSRGKISVSNGFATIICRGTGFAPTSGGELKDIQPGRVTRLGVVQRAQLSCVGSVGSCRGKP